MISLFALATLVASQQTSLPLQIVPSSQNPFERKDTVKESGPNEKLGIYLLNDFGVSDKAYEAVVASANKIRLVKIVHVSADGTSTTQWSPDGKPLSDREVSPKNLKLEAGDTAVVVETPIPTALPESQQDQPNINLSIAGSRASTIAVDGKLQSWQKIAPSTGKFADIRLSIRVVQYVGSFKKDSGTTATVEEVNYKVLNLMPKAKDKRDHLEVVQSGIPNVGSFYLAPSIDWDALEKDGVKLRNRNGQGSSRVVRKDGEALDPDNTHIDVSAARPYKYWSAINVYRASNIPGYFGHVAIQPN